MHNEKTKRLNIINEFCSKRNFCMIKYRVSITETVTFNGIKFDTDYLHETMHQIEDNVT